MSEEVDPEAIPVHGQGRNGNPYHPLSGETTSLLKLEEFLFGSVDNGKVQLWSRDDGLHSWTENYMGDGDDGDYLAGMMASGDFNGDGKDEIAYTAEEDHDFGDGEEHVTRLRVLDGMTNGLVVMQDYYWRFQGSSGTIPSQYLQAIK